MEEPFETYQSRITSNPAVLVGKPVVRGTRISVELVLGHLATKPDVNDVLEAYPHLTVDDVKACLAYAETVVHEHWEGSAGAR